MNASDMSRLISQKLINLVGDQLPGSNIVFTSTIWKCVGSDGSPACAVGVVSTTAGKLTVHLVNSPAGVYREVQIPANTDVFRAFDEVKEVGGDIAKANLTILF